MNKTGIPPGKNLTWLDREVEEWKSEGVISAEQAEAILKRYKNRQELEQGGQLVTVLAVIGALLLGIGVILFFAANWQAIPKWVKVSLIMGSIIVSYTAGFYFAFAKNNYPRVGRSLVFLGSILYGSGIWLIAQIFHISSHYPNGVLMWGLGIIPVAFVCGSLSILIEASILLTIWTVMEQTGFLHYNWLFPFFASVLVYLAYRLKSPLGVGLTIPGFVLWLALSCLVSMKTSEGTSFLFTFLLISVVGLLVYAIGVLHSVRDRTSVMKLPWQIVGLLSILISFFILSFRFLVHEGMLDHGSFKISAFYLLAFSLMTISSIMSLFYCYKINKQERLPVLEPLLLLGITGVVVFLGGIMYSWQETWFVAAVNVALFFIIIAVIAVGYRTRQPILVNLGLGFFVLDVIARYFDFFWDMLDKSVFFMVGGLLLLLGGTVLERNRRKVLREMRVNDYAA